MSMTKRSMVVGAVISVLLISTAIAFAQSSYIEPIDEATSANVTLYLAAHTTRIGALEESSESLFSAITDYSSGVDYTVTGGRVKTLTFDTAPRGQTGGNAGWDIALSPLVPLSLVIDSQSGGLDADFAALNLSNLDIRLTSGNVEMDLPTRTEGVVVNASVDAGGLTLNALDESVTLLDNVVVSAGSFVANIGENAAFEGNITVSNAGAQFYVPRDAAVQVNTGVVRAAGVNVPRSYREVSPGVWESPSFEEATDGRIVLMVDVTAGSIQIQEQR
jgi:hypothetical protein